MANAYNFFKIILVNKHTFEIHKTTLKMTEVIINEVNVYRDGKCLQFFSQII